MPEQKTPVSGAFRLTSLMYFCSGQPIHFCSGVDRGRMEALRAFEPLRDAQYEDPATKSYLEAFAKLEAGDPGAMAAFAAHVGRHADDQLASFHLKRLLNGATGTRIVMD